jgi:hypothetical protein
VGDDGGRDRESGECEDLPLCGLVSRRLEGDGAGSQDAPEGVKFGEHGEIEAFVLERGHVDGWGERTPAWRYRAGRSRCAG